MSGLVQVEVAPEPVERFRDLLGPDYAEVEAGASQARDFFAGRVIWQVNSTARGGGVAEMLRSHLAYVRAVGIDVRWVLAGGGADFFAVTKRIHNNLHGSAGDGESWDPPSAPATSAASRRPSPSSLGWSSRGTSPSSTTRRHSG